MQTKDDSLMGMRIVHGPGWDSLQLTSEALGMIADALEFTADDSRTTAVTLRGEGNGSGAEVAEGEARKMDLLAMAIRNTENADLWLEQDNRVPVLQALADAGVERK